jgi:hypothetical protein
MEGIMLFDKLNPNEETFTTLRAERFPWWENLRENKDVCIQIRKENKIDVYYNGGAILKDLKYDSEQECFTAAIHPKYLPFKDANAYQFLALNSAGIKFVGKIDFDSLSQLGSKELKAVTNRIRQRFGPESEKAIQYEYAKNDPYIIDTEFQWSKGGKVDKGRIDIVRLDVKKKKIVFIEVKTIGDPRLFSDPKTDEKNVQHQLRKYHDFAAANSPKLLDYYGKILRIKIDLGIITNPDVKKLSLYGWQVEPRPLLVFGDCNQTWINTFSSGIDQKINPVAYGSYYFGAPKPSLDLIGKSKGNRHIL